MLRSGPSVRRSIKTAVFPGAPILSAVPQRSAPRTPGAARLGRSQPWLAAALLLLAAVGCDKDQKRPHQAGSSSVATGGSTGTSPPDEFHHGPTPLDPCTTEGEVRECGRVYQTDGD